MQAPLSSTPRADRAPRPLESSPLLNPFVAVVALAGLAITGLAAARVAPGMVLPLEAACIVAGAAEAFKVTVGTRTINVSASMGVIIAALVALGPGAAIITAFAAALGAGFFPRLRPLHKTAFNAGLYALSAGAAGVVMSVLAPALASLPGVVAGVILVQVALAMYVAVNWVLLCTVLWLGTRRAPVRTWREDLCWLVLPLEVVGALGAVAGANYAHFGWVGAILCLVPLLATRQTLRLEVIKHAINPGLKPAAAP